MRSSDPLGAPRIDAGFFSEPADLKVVIQGLRAVLEIAEHQPLKANLGALRLPDSVPDDAALTEHIRRWSQTQYHPVGTCAMGVDEDSVVDAELQVRGVDNLRVIDASVMPSIIGGNQRDHHHDRRKGCRSGAGQAVWRVAISPSPELLSQISYPPHIAPN